MTAPVIPGWQERGLCRQVDPDLFYPEKGTGVSSLRQARRICDRCPVKAVCRQWALDQGEVYGVWGGTSESERRHIRQMARAREARLACEAEVPPC